MEDSKGFLIPVELRFVSPEIGHGVFALDFVKKGTEMWTPQLVEKIHFSDVGDRLATLSKEKAHEYLRQGFILATELDYLCVNVDDLGRFTNHSSNPNMGYADGSPKSIALRDILPNEELTCDYHGLGSPPWYKELCALYGVKPTDEVGV